MLYLGAKKSMLSAGKTLTQQVAALFRSGEQGAWYDPSDWSTLYQDSAGTTPVTAVGQPVGRMLDKSGRGNHADQPTAINRPVLSARVNLLTKTENLTDDIWLKRGFSAPVPALAPDGTNTAFRITENNTNSNPGLVYNAPGAGSIQIAGVWLRASAPVTMALSTNGVTSGGSISVTTSWAFYSKTGAAQGQEGLLVGGFFTLGIGSGIAIDVWHPQQETGSTATRYQWVNTATDYDTVGFPHFLSFNGTNSWMSTAAIDFTGTDKMTVVAGVRKSGSLGVILETSVNAPITDGSFYLINDDGGKAYSNNVRGSVQAGSFGIGGFAGPDTAVLTFTAGIATSTRKLRRNGANETSSGVAMGIGNLGAHPLFLGARAGSSLFFNGQLYGLIIRGALSTDPQIIAAERLMAQKTGVAL